MRRTGTLAMMLTALFAGCGGSEKPATNDARQASTTTAEPDSDQLSAAEFAALNAVDDRLQAAVHEFQNNLRTCTRSGDDATAQECFASKYVPFGQSVAAALGAIEVAKHAAGGECTDLLGNGKNSARDLQQTSEAMRAAFAEGDFAHVDAAAFVSAFEGYRNSMDTALAACGKDQGAVRSDETDSQPAPPEPTAQPSDDIGKTVTSGGIKLEVKSVRRARAVTYEGGTQSEETPNATARTLRAPQGGRYVFVGTRLTNDTSGGIDLTCGFPVDAKLLDEEGRSFDPIDGLSQIRGNPECNANVQPGFKTKMTWVFLLPPGAKAHTFSFSDATDLGAQIEASEVALPTR